jgi:hypothetical protein
MNLYLLERNGEFDYDTYNSVIVCAESESAARRINPGGFYEWNEELNSWEFVYSNGIRRKEDDNTWVNINELKCKLIGKANSCVTIGVVLASFNAG